MLGKRFKKSEARMLLPPVGLAPGLEPPVCNAKSAPTVVSLPETPDDIVLVDLEDAVLTCRLLRKAGRSRRGECICELPIVEAARDEGRGTSSAGGVGASCVLEAGRSLGVVGRELDERSETDCTKGWRAPPD